MLETEIQTKILNYLRSKDMLCFRVNNGGIYDAKLHAYRRSVSLKGVPDILGCLRGKMLGIEVKTPKGKQSVEQVMFQKRLEAEGGIYILARSIEDVSRLL